MRHQIEPDAAGRAQRKVVGEFKARLARIVQRNETLPDMEKMDRNEFVVDVAGRRAIFDGRAIVFCCVAVERWRCVVTWRTGEKRRLSEGNTC